AYSPGAYDIPKDTIAKDISKDASPKDSAPIAKGVLPSDYSIKSDYADSSLISSDILLNFVLKQSHSVNLLNLESETWYEYKASSCADRCANSSIYTFKTAKTVLNPYVNFFVSPASVPHGTSAVITLSAYSRNPGGVMTTRTLSWDDGGTKSISPKFGGESGSFVPNSYPTLSVVSITFTNPGTHTLTFTVTDNYGKTSSTSTTITVGGRVKCASTSSIYYPSDTSCTNKWPYDGQSNVGYNNDIGACHAVEVCDDSLDYLLSDAESCCNAQGSYSPNPTKNRGYDYSKSDACTQAIQDTKNKNPMVSLSSESSMKVCKTAYLVRSIGSKAIYMKDYYTGEACCKDASFCSGSPHFTAAPWPQSNIKFNELWCYYWDYGIFGKSARNGWYNSDSDPTQNNVALADIPTHASVNTMNTGTCVDYSFLVTTVLRKAGYTKSQIMSVSAPGHLYNLVWIPGASKYEFIDTVGNTGGDFFTGPGWTWNSGGPQSHCTYASDKCSNDGGRMNCPAKSQVYGC
ncbi:hypothetical protein HZC07_06140, partial [Candidatus Micrarchaeota archaeon]|nr:hypothetical protein [Candidatus Micrarchaeota archaeon]